MEIFPPDADAVDTDEAAALCKVHGMSIAAVGTGAGWVKHKLHLCHPDAEIRVRARAFIGKIIARAAKLGAPAILGSMQGRVEAGIERGFANRYAVARDGKIDDARAARRSRVRRNPY